MIQADELQIERNHRMGRLHGASVDATVQPWNIWTLSRREIVSRVVFFSLVIGVLVLAGFANWLSMQWVNQPFAGFLVNERMVLGNVGGFQWTGTASLKFPDKIIAANGQHVSSMKELNRIVRGVPVGEPITYTVQRGENKINVNVPTMLFRWTDLAVTFGIPFVSGLLFLFIGVVVFVLKPDNQISWVFLISSVLLAVYTITSFDVQSTHAGLIRLSLFVNTFFPAAFIHLSFLFPQRLRYVDRRPNVQIIPYLVSLLTIIPLEVLYPNPGFVTVYQWVRSYVFISALFVIGSLLKAYFKRSSALARQRAKVVGLGALIAFPITGFAYYVSLFGGDSVALRIDNNFLALPLIVFPASIAFAIARHNLFDVDVYIKRAVGYVLMTVILAAGYLSIQTVTGKFVFRPLFGDLANEVYPIAFALLVVFCFNPINRMVQDMIDRIFFRKALDYKETVRSVSSALTSLLNLDQILERVVQTVRREMFIDTVGLVVLDPQMKDCRSYFAGDESEGDLKNDEQGSRITYNDPLLALIAKEKGLITKYDIREDPRYGDLKESCGRSFADLGASLALPLVYQGEVTGVLILGNKKSGHFYSREDVDLLDTMANAAAVAIENAKLAEKMKKEESVRTNLARYLSPQIVDQIMKNDVRVNLGGAKKVVTVLFSDIRNFTAITELRDPDELVRQLNEYFTEMANIIFEHGGSLDKYIGDAIVAVFGSLIDLENSAHNAAQAALKMMGQLPELNERWAKEYGLRMQIGIGLSTGEVFLGNIGSPERMEFTVIGDTVNVASRFSGLAKPGQILMTKEVVVALRQGVTVNAMPSAEVKGKTGELEVFELVEIG